MSACIPFWQQRYEHLVLECNQKGVELFGNDPRFSMVVNWEPHRYAPANRGKHVLARYAAVKQMCESHGWDHLNLVGVAEFSCLSGDEQYAFAYTQDEREYQYNINLYEHLFRVVGIDASDGWVHHNTIWIDPDDEKDVANWRAKNADMFVIFCVMAGSGQNKIFPTWLESFCRNLIDTLPNAKIFLLGDQDCTREVWQCERTVSLVHGTTKYPLGFKQALLMTKYVDFVFGPETGLLVGAGMMGTPKSMLFTLANMDQVVKHHRNDFSLQSKADCSPCYTLAYSGLFCPKEDKYGLYPVCTDRFDLKKLRQTIARHYDEWVRNHA